MGMRLIESSKRKFLVLLALLSLILLTTTALPMQDNAPRRVRFPRGRTTTVLKGVVVNDRMNHYVFGAKAGQRMTVHITSSRSRAQFDLYPVNERSALVSLGAEDTTDWEGRLPQTGDYVVSVYSNGGNIRYTLELTIR